MAALEDLNGVEETFRKQPTIHITGFGSFEGVPENPTEELLSDAMRSDLLKRVQASVVLLPVSHECVDLVKSRVLRDRENKTPQILVHLGVNTTANSIHLERCAHNEASFSCKDNSGWKPQREAIDERLPFAHELGTSVDVESLVNRLRELGHNCRASGISCMHCYLLLKQLGGSLWIPAWHLCSLQGGQGRSCAITSTLPAFGWHRN